MRRALISSPSPMNVIVAAVLAVLHLLVLVPQDREAITDDVHS
jgi:hypothetical protein